MPSRASSIASSTSSAVSASLIGFTLSSASLSILRSARARSCNSLTYARARFIAHSARVFTSHPPNASTLGVLVLFDGVLLHDVEEEVVDVARDDALGVLEDKLQVDAVGQHELAVLQRVLGLDVLLHEAEGLREERTRALSLGLGA